MGILGTGQRNWEVVVTPTLACLQIFCKPFLSASPLGVSEGCACWVRGLAVLPSASPSLQGWALCQRWGHAVIKALRRQKLSLFKPKVNHKAYFCLQHFWPTTRKTQINFKHIYSLRSSGWEVYKSFCQTGALLGEFTLDSCGFKWPQIGVLLGLK